MLDAQHFGVPQRRRRVFVVGYIGDWRPALAVLLERESLSRHPAPRGKAGKSAPTVPSRRTAGGGLGTDFDTDGGLIAGTLQAAGSRSRGAGTDPGMIAEAFGGGNGSGPINIATARTAHGGPAGRLDFDSETFIAHSLRAEGFDASEDGTGRGAPLVAAHAFDARQRDVIEYGDRAGPLDTDAYSQAIAFDCKSSGQNGFGVGDISATLRGMGHKDSHTNGGGHASVYHASAVRRLTPRECERLQGFPDDFTLVPHRGRPMADGPRYKMLGNSMAVPVLGWIGRRIEAVEAILEARAVAA